MTVAALIVTHQSESWIEATLTSVLAQTRVPDRIVLVDDASTDRTRQLARAMVGSSLEIVDAAVTSTGQATRIAANFRKGLQACGDCAVAVLGDHDDLWDPGRLEHQVSLLLQHNADMVAGDGRLVDGSGKAMIGTLRETFPVPADWWRGSPAMRMRIALRQSIATGGASAVRPAAFVDVAIPSGWLHDRWWSLVATARERMLLDQAPVIDYRVTSTQQVGLDRGHQAARPATRLVHAIRHLPETSQRIRDLRNGVVGFATSDTADELRGLRLLRNLA